MKHKMLTGVILGVLAALMIPAVSLAAALTPTQISTKTDLLALASRVNGGDSCMGEEFELTADIAVDGAWTPIGSAAAPFNGTFDGKGFRVTSYTAIGLARAGFFGEIGVSGTVKNTAFSGAVSTDGSSNSAAGGIAAGNRGQIINCSFTGSAGNAWNAGGLVGDNYGLVRNCFSSGTVYTSVNSGAAGGLIGEIMVPGAIIQNCYSAASISTSASASFRGGLVGYYTYGQISNCYWRLSGCANAVQSGAGTGYINAYSFNDSGVLESQVDGSNVLLDVLNAFVPTIPSLTAWTAGTGGYTYPVLHPSVYEIQAAPAGYDFGTAQEGYTTPGTQSFVIANTGSGAVTISQPAALNFTVGELSKTDLNPAETATFTLQPKTGLVKGTYTEAIVVTGSNGVSAALQVHFRVVLPPVYAIEVSPILKNFGLASVGYTPPGPETVTITNTGNLLVAISQPTAVNYTVGLLSSDFIAPGGTSTFTVQPKAGLSAGTYNETISITGSNSVSASLQVSFSVSPAPVYAISVSPILKNFGAAVVGYTPPGSETVTITNTGDQPVTVNQPTAANYTVGALSKTALDPMDTAAFTVQPKAGLAAGAYDETVAITGSNGISASLQVSFTVNEPTPYQMISGAGGTYNQQGPSGLTFRANGDFSRFIGVTVDGDPVDESNYDAREGSTIVTLHPDYLDTLALGTHQIRILFTDGYSDASFTVDKELDPVTPPTGDNDEAAVWGMIMILCAAALALLLRRPAHRQR